MTAKSKRLVIIACIAALLGIAVMLVLGALRDNIVFFYTPSEILEEILNSVRNRSSDFDLPLGFLKPLSTPFKRPPESISFL